MMTKEREKTYEELVPPMTEQERRNFNESYRAPSTNCDCGNIRNIEFNIPDELLIIPGLDD